MPRKKASKEVRRKDERLLIKKSAVRDFLRTRDFDIPGVDTVAVGDEALSEMDLRVQRLLEAAVSRAARNGRKTLKPQDF